MGVHLRLPCKATLLQLQTQILCALRPSHVKLRRGISRAGPGGPPKVKPAKKRKSGRRGREINMTQNGLNTAATELGNDVMTLLCAPGQLKPTASFNAAVPDKYCDRGYIN